LGRRGHPRRSLSHSARDGGRRAPRACSRRVRIPRVHDEVVEQEGQIWRRSAGSNTLFLDIRSNVAFGGEEGLLSLAFDGAYSSTRFIYVNFVNNHSDIVFARYRANARLTRVPAHTKKVIARVPHPGAGNHNGGQIVWGPDGRLYMSTGDGGGGCDPGENAQDTSSWLGKLFSMDPRNLSAGRVMEIYGLRNPYRFSFDRGNGRFYLADVGQSSWEEVNTQRSLGGSLANYGWDVFEGFEFNTCGSTALRGPAGHHEPIDAYDHSLGCSVTGGFVYRGSKLRWLRGWYVFADYCSGRIWRLLFSNGTLVRDRRLMFDTGLNISSFGESGRGELYVVDHGGTVYRLLPN
jgi:glucose/arabinose dehydrogenase